MSSITLASRVQLMKPSPILMLAARAGELKAQGHDVISLSIGEPDWTPYENIKEAAIASIREGKTKYTPAPGIPELRKAIAEQASKDLDMKFDFTEVTVSSGAKFVLFAALQALVNPGDEVILIAPFWASYTTMVELAGGIPKIVVCDQKTDFKITPAMLKAAIGPRTKVILMNSPSNPTGKIYSKDELAGLAEILRGAPGVAVISDDIYNRLCFESKLAPHLLQAAPDLRDRVILLNGASKSYAMTGWRLGWALGPKAIVTAMANYQSQSVSCANSMAQYAAIEAIKNSDKDVAKTVESLKDRAVSITREVEKIPGIKAAKPEGAFYLWIDVSAYMGKSLNGKVMKTSDDLSEGLLTDQMVAAVPGTEFGLDGYFRLSYALSKEKATEAAKRMATFFAKLK
jgi:aspartate aminotransferase